MTIPYLVPMFAEDDEKGKHNESHDEKKRKEDDNENSFITNTHIHVGQHL